MRQRKSKKRNSSIKNTLLSTLLIIHLIFLNGLQFAQVKIKERIAIKPEVKLSEKTTMDYSPIEFQFGGPRPFSFTIESPSGSFSGSNAGFGAPPSVSYVPAVNGDYTVTVNGWTEGQSNVGYSVTWLDTYGNTQWIAGYEMWFWFGGVQVDSFKFSRIPEPVPFDFSILLNEHFVYGTEESVINFWYRGDVTDKNVTLTFANDDPDIIFFDRYLQMEIGNTLTTTLDNSENFSVKSKSVNIEYPKQITVIARSNGLQRTDSLTIVQPEYVRAYFDKENLSPGDMVNVIVKRVNAKYGYESDYPDTTHFEVGIKTGCGLGLILDLNGVKKDYFNSIQQPIRFVVADSLGSVADSVIVLEVGAPIIAEEEVVAGSIISIGNILQKNKNLMNQNMSVGAEPGVNNIRNLKALDVNSCTVYNPIYENNSDDAEVSVSIGGDCATAEKCSYDIKPPSLLFKETNHKDPCTKKLTYGSLSWKQYDYPNYWKTAGYDTLIYPKLVSDYDLKVCYDDSKNKWKYKFNDDNTITVGYNLTWCEDKILDRHEKILNTLDDLNKINDTLEIKLAIKSIDSLNHYPVPAGKLKYGISKVYYYHEIYHKNDFIILVTEEYNKSDLFKRFASIDTSCNEVKSIKLFKAIAQQHIENLRSDFQDIIRGALKTKFLTENYDIYGFKINQNEIDTQNKAWINYALRFVTELENKLKAKREGRTK